MLHDTLDGIELLRLSGLKPVQPFDDLADEYSIRSSPTADSGIVVYAKYPRRDEWYANPGLRPVVVELLKRIGIGIIPQQAKDAEPCPPTLEIAATATDTQAE